MYQRFRSSGDAGSPDNGDLDLLQKKYEQLEDELQRYNEYIRQLNLDLQEQQVGPDLSECAINRVAKRAAVAAGRGSSRTHSTAMNGG